MLKKELSNLKALFYVLEKLFRMCQESLCSFALQVKALLNGTEKEVRNVWEFGDAEAKRLVEEYADLILRLSYTYLRSTHDAEDICQTVFLKLLMSERQFDSPEHEKAWIVRTAINACKDELRAFRRKSVPLENLAEMTAPPVPESDTLEAVMGLSPKYREAIYLFYYEGYSVKEIAKLLHRSEAAVSAHLSRGRKQLHQKLLGGDMNEQQI